MIIRTTHTQKLDKLNTKRSFFSKINEKKRVKIKNKTHEHVQHCLIAFLCLVFKKKMCFNEIVYIHHASAPLPKTLIVHTKIHSYIFDVISLFLVLTVTLFCSDRSESDRCCVLFCVRLVLVVFLCFAFYFYYSIALCFFIWYLSLPLNSRSIINITVCDQLAEQEKKISRQKKNVSNHFVYVTLFCSFNKVYVASRIHKRKIIRKKNCKRQKIPRKLINRHNKINIFFTSCRCTMRYLLLFKFKFLWKF